MNTHSSTVRRVRVVAVLVGTALLATVVIAAVAAAAANGAILPTAPAAAPTQTSSTMADNGGTPTNADGYVADAAKAAKEAGVSFGVASGWRSPAYQAWLLDAAVQQYGSKEAAARWVGTPENSLHVAGKAVDIGPYDAADWLDRKGAAFGLCRTYENEKWHFELFPSAVDEGCPAMYADPSQDPRMSR